MSADLNLAYLQAQLARIDLMIRREVRRWVMAGQDPNDDYRGMYVTHAEVEQLLNLPPGTSWGQSAVLPPEEETAFAAALDRVSREAQTTLALAQRHGVRLRWCRLVDAFGLDRVAQDILLICLAPAFDTRYERLFGYLQDNVNRRRPTVRLLLNMLGGPGFGQFALAQHLQPHAPLLRFRLLERVVEPLPVTPHWLNQTLHPDDTVVAWLMGNYESHASLARAVTIHTPQDNAGDHYLARAFHDHAAHLAARLCAADPPVVVFYGPDQLVQDAAVRQLALQLECPLLFIKLQRLVGEGISTVEAVELALRDARLTGAIPYFFGWDSCLTEQTLVDPELLAAICDHPGLVIVSSRRQWQVQDIERTRELYWYEFALPGYGQRIELWQYFLNEDEAVRAPAHQDDARVSAHDIENLAAQFSLTSSQIRDAVLWARDRARQEDQPLNSDYLFVAARTYSSPRLSALAQKLPLRYVWDDIILPPDRQALLREVIATVRQRAKVLEEWGAGRKLASSAGITVLFAGPPGTGKTMAAEVIAGELKLDLYKIDLSNVVSKYIGETEKNLDRIFREAANSNAILFFDEADAIFGKRSEVKDAHDRYANIEISYLLQRMEAYDGVTILATNLRANLDEAFTRRLHFAVDFPFPQEEDRLRIWQTIFPPRVPRARNVNFGLLAGRFELAGGNIRNIIFGAAHLAANEGKRVTMTHLLQATKRELQKMGRLTNEEDFRIP